MTELWTKKIYDCNIPKRTHQNILKFIVVTKGMYIYTLKVTRHLGHFFFILLPLQDWCDHLVNNQPYIALNI